jgi:hypothetical protein
VTHRPPGGPSLGLVTGILVVALLPAGPALAQGRSKSVAATPAATQNKGWSFYVSTEGDYETNPTFEAAPNDPSDFSGSGGGGFTYTHLGARGSVNLSGDGRALLYRELTSFNTFTFGSNLNGSYKAGPKTDLTFNGSVSSDYARKSEILVSEGIVLAQTKALTMRFGAGVSHSLSSHTGVSFNGRFEEAKFDQDSLRDGSTLGGTVSLNRQLSRSTSLSFGYTLDRTDSDVQTQNINTGYAGVRIIMSPRADLDLNAGATSSADPIGGGQKVTPYGNAALNLKYPRVTSSLSYSHQVKQDYGIGRVRESDLGSFSLARAFGTRRQRTFTTTVNYGFNKSTGTTVQEASYQTFGASAGLQVPIGRSLAASTGYSYFRTSQAAPVIDSHAVYVSLAYRFQPR